jgi:hypothetical protein
MTGVEGRDGPPTTRKGILMNSALATNSVRFAVLAAVVVTLASLTGCSSGINTMTAPTTPTRMSHFGAYPIDDPSPVSPDAHMPPVIARGYGVVGG